MKSHFSWTRDLENKVIVKHPNKISSCFVGTALENGRFKLYNRDEIAPFDNYTSDVIARIQFINKKLIIIAHGYEGIYFSFMF